MNKKLRKKILKELKYLLEEEFENVEFGGTTGGGGMSRTTRTAAGIGGGAIAGAVGGAAIGAGGFAAAGAAIGTAAFPVVGTAIGAAVGVIAGLGVGFAFRTAGYKEVKEDIQDAIGSRYLVSSGELANNLHTKKYIDLTAMEDATDEADFKSFMGAMKIIVNKFMNPSDDDDYKQVISNLESDKDFLKTICNTGYFLLNEFGPDDRMYYVKCAKLNIKKIQTIGTGISCSDSSMEIPVALLKLPTENEIEDMPSSITKGQLGGEIVLDSPYAANKCGSPVPKPDATSGQNTKGDSGKKQGGNRLPSAAPKCIKCVYLSRGCKGKDVTEIQQKLTEFGFPVEVDGVFGTNTYNAVMQFQKSRNIKVDGIVGPETCKAMEAGAVRPATPEEKVEFEKSQQDFAAAQKEFQAAKQEAGLEENKKFNYERFYSNNRIKKSEIIYERLMKKWL